MLHRNLIRSLIAAMLIVLVSTGSAFGRGEPINNNSSLPSYYPASFQNTGVIAKVSGSQLVIGGLRYTLSPNVLVHSTSTEHSSRFELRVGKESGFTVDSTRGTAIITEIWLLPDGTVRPN